MKIGLPKDIAGIERLYGPEYIILKKLTEDTAFASSFEELTLGKKKIFEKVSGVRNFLQAFTSTTEAIITVNGEKKSVSLVEGFLNKWQKDADKFREMRKKYLLYE